MTATTSTTEMNEAERRRARKRAGLDAEEGGE